MSCELKEGKAGFGDLRIYSTVAGNVALVLQSLKGLQLVTVLLALEQPWEPAASWGSFGIPFELTLGSKRRHMLMTPAMNLMTVCIHGQDQDHDAAHDASGHGTHRGTFNHVQCDNLITFIKINKQTSFIKISQV